ncbi:MAG: DUF2809 domain-containing protein [Lachnospiraceae bacterium]|nr:DUF2809 domain-containing protein [Lachnospiraceae bacterium]
MKLFEKLKNEDNAIQSLRLYYLITTIFLILVEVLIALYVDDNFIRPYLGDVIVVVVLYTFVRIFVPQKCQLLPLYVFIFAVFTEITQYFHLVKIIGLADNRFFRTLLGGTFDLKDISCYAIGCILLTVYEVFCIKNKWID